jgi:predicted RNA binding protein YcfA (HicA-like mRNA interferase family)
MDKLPILSGREIIKILEKIGYSKIRQRGSHIRLSCSNKKSITVPDHKTINMGLLGKILRDAELSREKFKELFKN